MRSVLRKYQVPSNRETATTPRLTENPGQRTCSRHEQAPAEAIDHAHHRTEAIKYLSIFRDHGARSSLEKHKGQIGRKSTGTHTQVHSTLYVERCDVERRAETRENRQQHKPWQESDPPSRRKPYHTIISSSSTNVIASRPKRLRSLPRAR